MAVMGDPTPPLPTYSFMFGDAVTGDNQFIGTDGKHHWFVNDGADSYDTDVYERPTIQNYETHTADTLVGTDPALTVGGSYYATDTSDPAYFEYLDIVKGHYGYNTQFVSFGIELYGEDKVGDGGTGTADFGESSFYNIRLGTNPNGAGGLMLSSQVSADYQKTEFEKWNPEKAFGFLDTNRDVGGPGGIPVTNENPGSLNGFEDKPISDGELGGSEVLWTQVTTSVDGRPLVEFLLDYVAFNAAFPDYAITPETLQYLVFEANRGTKDNGNYLWNDKYSKSQAGTPYNDAFGEPQNVYELDTLQADLSVVPTPSAVLLGSLGISAASWRLRRNRRSAC